MKVSFLDLYTKDKKYVQLINGGQKSHCYVIDDDKLDSIKAAIDEIKGKQSDKNGDNTGKPIIYNSIPKRLSDQIIEIDTYHIGAIGRFLNNPYCVLGISTNATLTFIFGQNKLVRFQFSYLNRVFISSGSFVIFGRSPICYINAALKNAVDFKIV